MKRELTFKEDGQGASPAPRGRCGEVAVCRRAEGWSRAACADDSCRRAACRVALDLCAAEYAQVTRMLGNGRLEAFCFDGVNRLCHIRGKLRKRVWMGVGDIVLLGLRDFQDQKADIILKYDGDEARQLKSYGELPDTVQINAGAEAMDGAEFGDSDDNFDFADNASDDDDDDDPLN